VKRWFGSLPIHRKLVVMALVVTATALVAATTGLILLDVWRYRVTAQDDIRTLAQVVAESSAAAVMFNDEAIARERVMTAGVKPMVTRVCLYEVKGSLFASFTRAADIACDPRLPRNTAWTRLSWTAPVRWRGERAGTIYAERDLSDLGSRVALTALGGVVMFLLAALLAYAVAQRVQRTVSRPIVQLADAAREIGAQQRFDVPRIETGPDELGELVRAFTGMVTGLRGAREDLQRSNDALRQEVEERRRVEREREGLLVREREASRLKDEFLAAVSHELRTPLNAIVGWVQILSSTSPTAQTTTKAISSIVRNAHAQTRVIEDLIDVSRIATGKLTLRVEDTDLRRPVEGAADVLRPAAHAKRLEFAIRVPDQPCMVQGDPDRLQQVIWNLLSNAVKFTPEGGRVAVTLNETPDAYEIQVSDTGIGVPTHFLAHVFDRFRQADGSLTREHGGLGLGLAIVKELTELHGGTATVVSPGHGKGATFTVTLPRSSSAYTSPAILPAASTASSSDLVGVRVLAVDDNLDSLDIVAETLTAAGASVRLATRGADAIREWDTALIDVLICDLAMPDMSGFEVLEQIRAHDAARGRQTRAIALSAHASHEHIERCRAAGFRRHLAKPYKTTDLVEAVASAVA
jgi:signal transduction histidine kinase/CheY-like chemotaxis protein